MVTIQTVWDSFWRCAIVGNQRNLGSSGLPTWPDSGPLALHTIVRGRVNGTCVTQLAVACVTLETYVCAGTD